MRLQQPTGYVCTMSAYLRDVADIDASAAAHHSSLRSGFMQAGAEPAEAAKPAKPAKPAAAATVRSARPRGCVHLFHGAAGIMPCDRSAG
jgi:hypothetical protein